MQMSVRSCPLIYANQNQHRIERYGTKSIRSHTMNFAVLVHGDDRDAGGETSHCLAKIAWGKTHAAKTSLSNSGGRVGKRLRPAIAFIYHVRRSANWT